MLLIVAAIGLSVWAGIAAERRLPERAGPASRRALELSLYVVLPPVIFFNLARVEIDADLGGGIALGWIAVAVAAVAAWLLASRLLRLEPAGVGAVVVCTLIANSGYLGYPMVATLLGFDHLGEAVAYDVAVSSPAFLLGAFGVGAALGTRAGSGARQRTGSFFARNAPLYAAVAALLVPDALAPDLLVDASRVLVVALLPMGFFAVGAALAEDAEAGALRLPPPITGPTLAVISTKLVLLPGLLYLMALPLVDLPGPYPLLAAMPSGLNSMIVAHTFGLDLRITAEAVTWTTVIVVAVAVVASLL